MAQQSALNRPRQPKPMGTAIKAKSLQDEKSALQKIFDPDGSSLFVQASLGTNTDALRCQNDQCGLAAMTTVSLICCAQCGHMHSSLRFDCPQCNVKAGGEWKSRASAQRKTARWPSFSLTTTTPKPFIKSKPVLTRASEAPDQALTTKQGHSL